MEQRLSNSLARQRLSMQLMVFFGLAALLLTATGLYGVLSYVVNQRRREVGIRVALGAQPRQVIQLVAKARVVAYGGSDSPPGWRPPWPPRGYLLPGFTR